MTAVAVEMAEKAFEVSPPSEGDFVVAGQTHLMEYDDLADMDKLRQLFEAFNQKRDLLHLLDQCLRTEGVHIFIGEECGYEVLDELSVRCFPLRIGRPGHRGAGGHRADAHGVRKSGARRRRHRPPRQRRLEPGALIPHIPARGARFRSPRPGGRSRCIRGPESGDVETNERGKARGIGAGRNRREPARRRGRECRGGGAGGGRIHRSGGERDRGRVRTSAGYRRYGGSFPGRCGRVPGSIGTCTRGRAPGGAGEHGPGPEGTGGAGERAQARGAGCGQRPPVRPRAPGERAPSRARQSGARSVGSGRRLRCRPGPGRAWRSH